MHRANLEELSFQVVHHAHPYSTIDAHNSHVLGEVSFSIAIVLLDILYTLLCLITCRVSTLRAQPDGFLGRFLRVYHNCHMSTPTVTTLTAAAAADAAVQGHPAPARRPLH